MSADSVRPIIMRPCRAVGRRRWHAERRLLGCAALLACICRARSQLAPAAGSLQWHELIESVDESLVQGFIRSLAPRMAAPAATI